MTNMTKRIFASHGKPAEGGRGSSQKAGAPPEESARGAATGALAAIGDLALDERAAALADIHEDLSAALREAED